MLWLLYILLIGAVWHLLYESVIAPTLRTSLRHELFRLRDDLRRLKMDDSRLTPEVYDYLQDSLNNALPYLQTLEISSLSEWSQEVQSNPRIRRSIENRESAIARSPVAGVAEIERQTATCVSRAVAVNAGGWAVYIVPLALSLWMPRLCSRRIKGLLLMTPQDATSFDGVMRNEPSNIDPTTA